MCYYNGGDLLSIMKKKHSMVEVTNLETILLLTKQVQI